MSSFEQDLLIVANNVTRNLLFRRHLGKWTVETIWKPAGIQERNRQLPPRPFTMPCRALCGLDLKRPHLTCVTGCRIRRSWYGKLSNPIELERIIQIGVLKQRRFARQKDVLMKAALTIIENLLAN